MRIIKKIMLVTIASVLFVSTAVGQNPKIDSLERLLSKHKHTDTVKVNLLNSLTYEIFNSGDYEKAKSYSEQSMELALQLNYPKGQATSLWLTGLLRMKSDRKEALGYLRQALKIAEQIGDKQGICNYLTAIGNVVKDLGDIDASNRALERSLSIALEIKDREMELKSRLNLARNLHGSGDIVGAVSHLQEVVKGAEEISDEVMLSHAYRQLGVIHGRQGNYSVGLELILKSLAINEKDSNSVYTLSGFINIAGIQSDQNDFDAALKTLNRVLKLAADNKDSMYMSLCYTNMGNVYRKMGHPDAIDYYQKAAATPQYINIGQKINNMMNIGSIYASRKEFNKAEEILDEALALAHRVGLKRTLGEVYIQLGILYYQQKKYDKAKEYIGKALSASEKVNQVEVQRDCCLQFAEIYAATGDFKNAYTNYVQYKVLSDSLLSRKDARKVALLESSYKFAKERELYELEKSNREFQIRSQRQTILSLAIISLLVLLLAFAVYWSGRLKKRMLKLKIENINRELEENQKAMAVAKLKLFQNSERDAQTVRMLEDIGNSTGEGAKNIGSLINNYKLHVNQSNWDEFETLFTKVNASFWDKLNELCPTLTPNERKLCVFLKLNMSNKDIALITFQSDEALKKSRLRLRQKFNLDRGANLSAFIQGL